MKRLVFRWKTTFFCGDTENILVCFIHIRIRVQAWVQKNVKKKIQKVIICILVEDWCSFLLFDEKELKMEEHNFICAEPALKVFLK